MKTIGRLYLSLTWSKLPEAVQQYLDAVGAGPGTPVYLTKKVRVDNKTLREEYDALVAANGGKRMAAKQVLAEKYGYTTRHVSRLLRRTRSD